MTLSKKASYMDFIFPEIEKAKIRKSTETFLPKQKTATRNSDIEYLTLIARRQRWTEC